MNETDESLVGSAVVTRAVADDQPQTLTGFEIGNGDGFALRAVAVEGAAKELLAIAAKNALDRKRQQTTRSFTSNAQR